MNLDNPLFLTAIKIFLCGLGELAKEEVIELWLLEVDVIAVGCASNAPAVQLAHRSHDSRDAWCRGVCGIELVITGDTMSFTSSNVGAHQPVVLLR